MSEGLYLSTDVLLTVLRLKLTNMTPEERSSLFDTVEEGYCRFCGNEHPQGGWCQCENDE
jgi:hypothetical protein